MQRIQQVELIHAAEKPGATVHIVVWVDAALKPHPGMVLVRKGNPQKWLVARVYQLCDEGNASAWLPA
jgi:hypothetical protein